MVEIRHATLITNNDRDEVIRDATIQVKDGKIAYAGQGKAAPEFAPERVIDAHGNIIMPGFVNMHTHVPMNLFRSYADDLDLMTWLNTRIFPAEDKLTEESAYWASMAAMCELSAAGVIAFNEMYFFVDSIARAAQQSGLRGVLSRAVVTPAPGVGERMLEESKELFEKYNGKGRLKVFLSPHAQYTVNNGMLEQIAEAAKTLGTGVHMHVSETRGEHETCLKEQGMTPIELCQKVGLLDVPFYAAHCVWIGEHDMELMAEYNATVLSCPKSNLKLASGIAPLTEMMQKGVRVTLGTDGAASNNKLSMWEEMTYASFLQKGTTYDPKTMPAAQTLKLATRYGAEALGLNSGVVEAGKNADLVMVNTNGVRYTPDYDEISLAVYAGSDADVCMTMVGGDIIYEDGKFAFADLDEVKMKLAEYAESMKKI
ncbi:amidohydrolase family protein [Christensenella tenuis]|uniref:5-methylthioadenosine/S-adenosylhomocysteine deaminase n=1 Tax=Christensenella tenuis TaxID=2763033 RepID=A0ABR7EB11_9FIRM|nr:amidohydrolase [Christensenella tenuis]MBC5646976.1 amidohydrolase [Christensenella tenuis]